MKSLNKGTYGYLDRLKRREWLKAVIFLTIPIAVYFVGWAALGAKAALLRVICIVACLPGCNQTVHAILATRYRSMDRTLYEEIEAARGDRMVLYENVFTTYEKNYYVDCIVIAGREAAGYASDPGMNIATITEHLTKTLRANSYKQNVKIVTDRKAFLSRVRDLAGREPEQVPFREDERCPGMSREEVVAFVLKSIAL